MGFLPQINAFPHRLSISSTSRSANQAGTLHPLYKLALEKNVHHQHWYNSEHSAGLKQGDHLVGVKLRVVNRRIAVGQAGERKAYG